MKLTFPNAHFTFHKDRKWLANRLARIISVSNGTYFEPYITNEGTTSAKWALDPNNDWRLNFFIDDDTTAEIRYRYQGPGADKEGALAAWLCHAIGATVAQQPSVSGAASPTSQQTGVDSSVMVEALNAWASDLERGMQVCIAASILRKIAAALAAPQPAEQPVHHEVDWTQAGKLIEVVNSPWVAQHTAGTTNWAATVCRLMATATQEAQRENGPVGVVESAVHGAGGFHARLTAQAMPEVGSELYTTQPIVPALLNHDRATAIQDCIDRLIQGGKTTAAEVLRHQFAKDLGDA